MGSKNTKKLQEHDESFVIIDDPWKAVPRKRAKSTSHLHKKDHISWQIACEKSRTSSAYSLMKEHYTSDYIQRGKELVTMMMTFALDLYKHKRNSSIAMLTSSGAGIVGGILFLVGSIAAIPTLGATAPLIGIGIGLGVAGGAASGGAAITQFALEKHKSSKAKEVLAKYNKDTRYILFAIQTVRRSMEHIKEMEDIKVEMAKDLAKNGIPSLIKGSVGIGGIAIRVASVFDDLGLVAVRVLSIANVALTAAGLAFDALFFVYAALCLAKKFKNKDAEKLKQGSFKLKELLDALEMFEENDEGFNILEENFIIQPEAQHGLRRVYSFSDLSSFPRVEKADRIEKDDEMLMIDADLRAYLQENTMLHEFCVAMSELRPHQQNIVKSSLKIITSYVNIENPTAEQQDNFLLKTRTFCEESEKLIDSIQVVKRMAADARTSGRRDQELGRYLTALELSDKALNGLVIAAKNILNANISLVNVLKKKTVPDIWASLVEHHAAMDNFMLELEYRSLKIFCLHK